MARTGVLAPIACALVIACGKSEADDKATGLPPSKEQAMAIDRGNTLGQIDATMFADSAISAAAAVHARRADVRQFAVATAAESHRLREETARTAKSAGIKPTLSSNDITAGDIALTLSLINGGAKTTDVDGLYMSGMVSRDFAIASLAHMKGFVAANSDIKPFLEKVVAAAQARAAAIAAFEKKK